MTNPFAGSARISMPRKILKEAPRDEIRGPGMTIRRDRRPRNGYGDGTKCARRSSWVGAYKGITAVRQPRRWREHRDATRISVLKARGTLKADYAALIRPTSAFFHSTGTSR